jgi:ribosome-binding protein aMBF1 (putative translation factor)
MGVICNVCGRTMPHGVTVIRGVDNFVVVCDECYMDAEGYMEEMRGCGCGGNCE